MTAHNNADPGLAELRKERMFGGVGATKVREVRRIDLSDFEARKAEIATSSGRLRPTSAFSSSPIMAFRRSRSTKLSR
jgi:hypothetical protein